MPCAEGVGVGERNASLTPVGEGLKAFTLAEVLITLGIIGIVAAMTMPVLMQKYTNHLTETRLKKFYSIINQAVLMSKNTNGDYESWDYWIDESVDDDGKNINKSDEIDLAFQKYIAPYMKIAMTKEVVDGDGQKRYLYFLADGSAFASGDYSQNREFIFYPHNAERCIKLKTAESLGRCAFLFEFYPISKAPAWAYLYKKGVEPVLVAWHGDVNKLYKGTIFSCKDGSGAYCTAIIVYNGWKVPDNYPRKISY